MTTPENNRGGIIETTARINRQIYQLVRLDREYLEMAKKFLAEAATDLIDADLFPNLDILSNSGNGESREPIKQPLFNFYSRTFDGDRDNYVKFYLTPEGKMLRYAKPGSGPKVPYIISDFLTEAADLEYGNLSRLALQLVSSRITSATPAKN